jgi:hypothetical protein
LSDPVCWFSACAIQDGINAGSSNPVDRFQYLVYQRRLLLEALKTKAMLLALLDNKESAAKVATSFFELAIPEGKMAKLAKDAALDARMREIESMVPENMRAVSTAEMVSRERARIDEITRKAGKMPKVTPQGKPLSGEALAKHLNAQTAERSQLKSQAQAEQAARDERQRARRSPSRRPGQR